VSCPSRHVWSLAILTLLAGGACASDESVATSSEPLDVKSSVATYLQQRFFHFEHGNTYTSFIPIPAGQSTYQNNWRKQARNQPHEGLVTLTLARLGRCNEARSILTTFFQQQSPEGGYRYDTRPDRGPWDNQSYTAAPLLAFEAWEVYQDCGGTDFLRTAYDSLVRNKVWWDDHSGRRFPDESGKSCNGMWHWNDPIESIRDSLPESGFPQVPTWASTDGPQNQCSTDLNFYLAATYRYLAKMEAVLGTNNGFQQIFDTFSAQLRQQMWDPGSSFFYGVDRRTGGKVWVKDLGGWMALFAGVATPEQAAAMVNAHLAPPTGAFHTDFGIPSLDKHHPGFGSNLHWSGGFWPGLSLLAVKGLADYGYTAQAQRIASPFVNAVEQGIAHGIPLPEWYDSTAGNVGGLRCEIYDENSPSNPDVNCNYITSALALPMAGYAGLGSISWSCRSSAWQGHQLWTCSHGDLYKCDAAGPVQKICGNGCSSRPLGTDDVCRSSTISWSCASSAWQNQQLWTCSNGDLYKCQNGVPDKVSCPNGCISNPLGINDACR